MHPSRKQIQPGDKVPLRLSRQDRDLILKHANLDENTMRPLRVARVDVTDLVVLYTLDDLDELSGAVAAEVNHAKSGKLHRQLHGVWVTITDRLRAYEDGLLDDSLPR
jgi:hypothetical protein